VVVLSLFDQLSGVLLRVVAETTPMCDDVDLVPLMASSKASMAQKASGV
jgi:hypothetical protein